MSLQVRAGWDWRLDRDHGLRFGAGPIPGLDPLPTKGSASDIEAVRPSSA